MIFFILDNRKSFVRVPNQCITCNLLTTVLFSLAALVDKKRFSRALIISVVPCVMKKVIHPTF